MTQPRKKTFDMLNDQTPGAPPPPVKSAYGDDDADDFFLNVQSTSGKTDVAALQKRIAELEQQVQSQGGAIQLMEGGEFEVGNFRFTSTGLVPLIEDITETELQAVGIVIFRLFDSLQFMIGDWLNDAAQYEWGLKETIARAFRKKLKTIDNWKSIATNVAYHVRRKELDYSHHAEVAALPQNEQIRWLALAVDNGWGRDDMRTAIAKSKQLGDGSNKKTGRPATSPATVYRPYKKRFTNIWRNLMDGVSPQKEDIRALKKWLNELEKSENP